MSDDEDRARHQRNGHTIELAGSTWRCLQCWHWFDAAVDAEIHWCGDPCHAPCPSPLIGTLKLLLGGESR